jgi:hypothetical protein
VFITQQDHLLQRDSVQAIDVFQLILDHLKGSPSATAEMAALQNGRV